MRTIRFRGTDILDDRHVLYGDLVQHRDGKTEITIYDWDDGCRRSYEVDPESVGQNTDMRDDSTGKEIYENGTLAFEYCGIVRLEKVRYSYGKFVVFIREEEVSVCDLISRTFLEWDKDNQLTMGAQTNKAKLAEVLGKNHYLIKRVVEI